MAFKPSRSKKHDTASKGELNMNSMMDMMTIILLFLLKSYSTSGIIVTASENLELPVSSVKTLPMKDVNVSVARDYILVNDVPVVEIATITDNTLLITPLYNKLLEKANEAIEMEEQAGVKFNHEVIIQGDIKTPYGLLFKIFYTSSQADFNKIRLLTVSIPK